MDRKALQQELSANEAVRSDTVTEAWRDALGLGFTQLALDVSFMESGGPADCCFFVNPRFGGWLVWLVEFVVLDMHMSLLVS